MELLAQVGQDLPGAVQVVEEDREPDSIADPPLVAAEVAEQPPASEILWRFSLAGVSLKFSMLRIGDRLTLPAYGEGGDWIVKLPDPEFRDVPRNEYAMMSLAAKSGIDVPERLLVHRDNLKNLPSGVWPGSEEYAYAVRRFDRDDNRGLIHIEDFAQVRNVYPYGGGKYQGNFETVASLAYRGQDVEALRQVARRLAFNVLISNGDAHLKNWSLIYPDKRRPHLAPAYDLVSTEFYRMPGYPEDLGLRFGKSRSFIDVTLGTFGRLERKLGARSAGLVDCVVDTVDRVTAAWPDVAGLLDENTDLRESIDTSIRRRRGSILRRLGLMPSVGNPDKRSCRPVNRA
jgi:serine/threonine-protein kinase HipA